MRRDTEPDRDRLFNHGKFSGKTGLWRRHRQKFALVIVMLSGLVAVYITDQNAITREHDAQLATCERIQTLRDQSNGLTITLYDFLRDSANRQRRLLKAATLPDQRRAYRQGIRDTKEISDEMLVTGPTSCQQAVDHPGDYLAPAPGFIREGGPQVRLARLRSAQTVEKARMDKPLVGEDG